MPAHDTIEWLRSLAASTPLVPVLFVVMLAAFVGFVMSISIVSKHDVSDDEEGRQHDDMAGRERTIRLGMIGMMACFCVLVIVGIVLGAIYGWRYHAML